VIKWTDDTASLAVLATELVDAHLDTIEIVLGASSSEQLDEHVLYLQELVRVARSVLARA
jgi:hypothetical protein